MVIARIKWFPVLLKYEPMKLRAVAVHSVPWVLILFNISRLPVDFARFTVKTPSVFAGKFRFRCVTVLQLHVADVDQKTACAVVPVDIYL